MPENDSTPPVACTLPEDQEAERSARVGSILAASYRDATEREDGYTVAFDGSDETLTAVAAFVADERRCCSFAEYRIDVSPPYEETRLTVTGPEGTKAIFADLIELLEADDPPTDR